ncbi:MAG: hypothetical protein KF886_08990 [Candidatus Hydrogenedentes bacterium]|nr:hypothetical protein [Candidatus Hydrogenedentota bacterium]
MKLQRALRGTCWLAALIALAGLSAPGARALDGDAREALLSEATAAFQEGNRLIAPDPAAAQAQYEKATLLIERIIREGGVENGRLYYNLGNIWFQRGDIGRAILNYLRAEQYIPNNVNLAQNLAYVRQQRRDAFTTAARRKVLNTLFFWHYDISSGVRLRIFAVCFIAFWALAAARLYARRPGMNGALFVLGAASSALFLSLTLEARSYRNEPLGVILAEETVARKGDGETYQPSFAEPLHAGTEFRVREDRGAWLHVVLPDDRTCWIRRDAVGLVKETPGENQRAPG